MPHTGSSSVAVAVCTWSDIFNFFASSQVGAGQDDAI